MVFRKISSSAIAFILAPMLGAEEYGVYAFGIACLGIASVMVVAGFDRLAMREVAQLSETGKLGLLRGLIEVAAWTVIVVSVTVAVVGNVGLSFFDTIIAENLHGAVAITLVILPFVAVTLIAGSIMIGSHRIVLGQVPSNFVQPAIFITLCFAAYLAGSPLQGGRDALILYGVGAFAAFLFAVAGVFYAMPAGFWLLAPEYRSRVWMKSAAIMFLIGSLQVVQVNGTPLIVGLLQDATTTGIFSLSFAIAQLVSFIHFAVDRPLSPAVAQLLAKNDKPELQKILTRLARLALLFAVPVALVLIIFGDAVLGIFGAEFRAGYGALTIMVVSQLIVIALGQPGIVLMMAGFEKDVIGAMAVRTILLIGLNILLIPLHGLIGAALAVSLSTVFASATMYFRVRQRLRLNTTVL